MELTWLERREGIEDCWHKRLEVHHAIGWRTGKQHADGHCGQILLELDTPVHREQRVVLASHSPQKLTVRDASPATADYGVDTVALERRGEV